MCLPFCGAFVKNNNHKVKGSPCWSALRKTNRPLHTCFFWLPYYYRAGWNVNTMDTRLTIEEMVLMVLNGENEQVASYLRSLPSAECGNIRVELGEKLQQVKGRHQSRLLVSYAARVAQQNSVDDPGPPQKSRSVPSRHTSPRKSQKVRQNLSRTEDPERSPENVSSPRRKRKGSHSPSPSPSPSPCEGKIHLTSLLI